METKKIFLDDKNYYDIFYKDDKVHPLIFIAPGGAYGWTSPREADPVGEVFLNNNYHVAILHYRETQDFYPYPGSLIKKALDEIKKEGKISKIILLGFSAGGHLVCEYTMHYNDYNGIKPDLLMLAYPVITTDESYSHITSIKNLLGDKYNNLTLRDYMSLEKEVRKDSPDLFLWGTYTDESVNVMNSLLLLESYHKLNLNVEYHMYSKGGHGLSLGNEKTSGGFEKNIEPLVESWPALALNWLKSKLGE